MRAGRIHLIGIGGAGMSAIALVLLERGIPVSGSDIKESRHTARLREMGAEVFIGHRPSNVDGCELVVYSSAIPENNPELAEARRRGLPVLRRAEMLGRLMAEGKGIAVAGTHGKTTTTSMLAMIIRRAGLDPTYIVGGELNDVGSNAYSGRGDYVVAEADESDGSFLFLHPWSAVITNVELDHPDFYPDEETLKDYFRRFLATVSPDGFVVLNGDDRFCRELADGCPGRAITFGEGAGCDYRFGAVEISSGGSSFRLWAGSECLGVVRLQVPGRHNVANATAAAAAALSLGVEFDSVAEALEGFRGVRRRFQFVDEVEGIRFIDDYAHHPTEIRAVLQTARQEGFRRVVCLFQPHRYSRVSTLWRELGEALGEADLVVLTEIYPAGESPIPGVNSKLVLDALLERHPECQAVFLPERATLGESAARFLRPGDLVVVMGAGDISQCAHEMPRLFREGRKEKARAAG
ncbi:MAG: UDP-N-acetylmuramate--L-alanine ligase [Candidatus Geothermincolales bacterium]